MINFIIRSEDVEELNKIKQDCHYALTGSPAYVNSEIAICDNDETSFLLIIGNNNKCDITKEIYLSNIKDAEL